MAKRNLDKNTCRLVAHWPRFGSAWPVKCRLTDVPDWFNPHAMCAAVVTDRASRTYDRGETIKAPLFEFVPRHCVRRSRQRIGRVYCAAHDWPRIAREVGVLPRPVEDRLGVVVGEIMRAQRSHCEGAEASYLVDYGEWSGPASAHAAERHFDDIAHKAGYLSYNELYGVVLERTSAKWVYINLPPEFEKAGRYVPS